MAVVTVWWSHCSSCSLVGLDRSGRPDELVGFGGGADGAHTVGGQSASVATVDGRTLLASAGARDRAALPTSGRPWPAALALPRAG